MKVKVQYLGLIRSKLKKKGDDVTLKNGASISELLNKLTDIYGESLKDLFDVEAENVLDPTFIVTVNGVLIDQLRGIDTRLNEGDSIALMTLISGG